MKKHESLRQRATEVLGPDHPSLETSRAAFLFGNGGQLLVVEAKNPCAVWTLERLMLQRSQRVSEGCRILCVFRECRAAGVRDEAVEELPYIEFMTDVVDPDWLLADPVTLACFSRSITPEEREHALRRKSGSALPGSSRRIE